ncbi:hormogonium polysaccharide secretion pseudopilin HpsC [Chrysosporum bergii ANA360D]|uniref:Hormogonium polysaccharide secretion pseudopilin HpsC n=1 Tax=Chrysosporum bergii ANA360D TaxID=617107 RepID=A0AA43KD57_9CYAN|nr:hormogonium polysaccharide secretion pseudopilin HpsC [Chrysosporum bergii]MDH6061558.1 hormogonium polysaccharide secretion pseudopilin HpsC [Chrysosporum bergii ANA360D]
MMYLLQFILSIHLKRAGKHETSGFTLIELLVAMVLSVLIITPLFGVVISMLDTDRREQAKAATEQEIQSALDYIAQDLQQAVYIYDADGLTRNHDSNTITNSGIKDQIPPVKSAGDCTSSPETSTSVCTPILVFWKREFIKDSVGISSPTDTATDDGFAYSLVAYYLITNPNGSNSTWSPTARIGRFQIRGPVNSANANTIGLASDPGFNSPPLAHDVKGADLKQKMNQWQTSLTGGNTYNQPVTLVDFISTSTSAPDSTCSSGQRVGEDSNNDVQGFYACVDAAQILAQVYIRGNALARIDNQDTAYTADNSAYFPHSSIRTQGRGFLLP